MDICFFESVFPWEKLTSCARTFRESKSKYFPQGRNNLTIMNNLSENKVELSRCIYFLFIDSMSNQ